MNFFFVFAVVLVVAFHRKITHSGLERIPMIRQHSLKQQQSKQSSLSQQQNVDEIISTM